MRLADTFSLKMVLVPIAVVGAIAVAAIELPHGETCSCAVVKPVPPPPPAPPPPPITAVPA